MASLSKLSAATTTTEAPPTSSSQAHVIRVPVPLMESMAIAQFNEGKRVELTGNVGKAQAKGALSALKEFAQKHITENFQGRTPPDRIELVSEDGTEAITLILSKSYGTTKMPRARHHKQHAAGDGSVVETSLHICGANPRSAICRLLESARSTTSA